jgi:hypothetical protein
VRTFNAVGIEHSIARLMNNERRGESWDADVFRGGNPADLAEMLDKVAEALEQRFVFLPLSREAGTPGALLGVAVRQLRSQAEEMRGRKRKEPDNYHWEIFGAVLLCAVALLEVIEAMQPRQ